MKLDVTFAEMDAKLSAEFSEVESSFKADMGEVNVIDIPDSYYDINSYATGLFAGDIVLDTATTIVTRAFQYCNAVTSIYAPEVTSIAASSCTNLTSLKKLVLPKCKSIGNSSCSTCAALEWADLGACTSLQAYALRNSTKLATLIIRSATMCTLSNYALNSTAIWNGKGHVYVPSALIAKYQAASNWAKIHAANAATFRALEDYTVDGTITGELDAEKI